jgi:toxin FitB
VTIPNASKRLVVDSSGWVEYLGNGPKAEAFAQFFEGSGTMFVPTIIVYEVFKKILKERGPSLAERFLLQVRQLVDSVIELDAELAVRAAQLSLETGLPMADAIIYATANAYGAELITSDAHFSGLAGVTIL